MSSLLSLVAAKAKLAAVVAGTALATATVVGGGGALVFQNVGDETAVVVADPVVDVVPDPVVDVVPDPVVDVVPDPVVDVVPDPVEDVVTDPVEEPAVKQPNPRAVANHSDGKGRDDERASIRGGGSRDPHAAKAPEVATSGSSNTGQGRR